MKAIINGRIITEQGIEKDKVLIIDDKIIAIQDEIEFLKKDYEKDNLSQEELEIIDAENAYVSPGFIDIHIHGSGGCDTMDGTLESLKVISKSVAKSGTTAFLPTTMTMSKEDIYKAFDNVGSLLNNSDNGAEILGVHMEGPFISKTYKGAQKEDFIKKPDFDFIQDYVDVIKIISMAPEEDKDNEFLKEMSKYNTVISIGHSNGTFEEALSAIKAGASHSTHSFNAMTPLNHRKPGVVGAVLSSDVSAELIADGIHVHPGLFQLFIDIKGKDKVVLITDSMRAGNMPEGEYDLGGQNVVVKDGSARLLDGTLAGSILTLNTAIKNVYKNTNLELNEAVNLASLNPAKVLGIADKKGSIKEGKDADVVIFDKNFNVKATFVKGQRRA